MNESPECSYCREPLASGLRVEGLCPRCLLLLGMGADLAAHRHIGPFEVLGEIGRGGMGVIFKAYQTRLHRVVALKVLSKALADDKAFLQRFEREAQAAAALNHPNIVTVYDVGADAGEHYIAMEYVDGPNLQERLDANGPLGWTETLRIGQQALRGLAAAHRIGVVHRDIKPHNILINGVGLVKVADFGLAKRRDDATGEQTRTGVVVGSLAYMAPEQARGEEVDARTDIFALGATLYTLLVGQPPFRGQNQAQLLQKILFEKPPALRSVNVDIPTPVARLVERALEKDPADRFASAEEMGEAVDAALSGMAATRLLGPAARRSSQWTGWTRWTRWTLWIWMVVLLIACLGVIVGVWLARQERARPEPPPLLTRKPSTQVHPVDGPFYDARLAARVRLALNLAAGDPLTSESLAPLTQLDASDLGVKDLRGIEQAKNLKTLNLTGNPINDLAPLEGLRDLVHVDLMRIVEIDGTQLMHLRSHPKLASLHFEGAASVDDALRNIAAMPALEMLTIVGAYTGTSEGVRRLESLKRLHGLSLVDFMNPIDDGFEAIGRMKGIDYLGLTGSNVSDAGIERLAGLDRLRHLSLWKSKATDRGYTTIARLPSLEILSLSEEKITDDGLRALAAAPNLEYLCTVKCRTISDAGVKALASARHLTALNLCDCPGITAKGIESLTSATLLRELLIGPGPAADLAGLEAAAKLPHLTYLTVRPDKPLSQAHIEILMRMKSLRFLGIPAASAAPQDLARLRSALPNCEIQTIVDPNVTGRYSGPS